MIPENFRELEQEVLEREGNYKGLEAEALLTSQADFETIFTKLIRPKSWVEFGSGYGLGPLLFANKFPEAKSTGIEFEKVRYETSLKLLAESGLKNVSLHYLDLLTSEIPISDYYFFYFPTGHVLDRILSELGKMEHEFRIVVIESHGDFLERLKFEEWLEKEDEVKIHSARHHDHAVIFKKIKKRETNIFDHSFQEHFLIIKDEYGRWIAESQYLEYHSQTSISLKIPNRTVLIDSVEEWVRLECVSDVFWPALKWRKLGEVKIETDKAVYHGFIRKIYVSPFFELEISSGPKVKWMDIKFIKWEHELCYDQLSQFYYYPLARSE